MPPEADENRDKAFLYDVVHGVRLAVGYVEGVTREQFDQDPMAQDAVIRRLTVVGEATKRLSPDFRERHPGIPWKQMAGMRDVIVHEYDRVDLDTVWNVLQNEFPGLLSQLERIVEA